MKRLLISFLLLLSVLILTSALRIRPCGPGEEYRACGFRNFEQTCQTRLVGPPSRPQSCEPGCYCRSGYVRHAGRCIRREQCSVTACGPGEEYRACGFRNFEQTCQTRLVGPPSRPQSCEPGCYCRSGYVRHAGRCIRREQCSACGPGEEYRACGFRNFEQTCQTRLVGPPSRPQSCEPGCYCRSGYVRHASRCIRRDQCSDRCPNGMVFKSCGSGCGPSRCGDPPNSRRICPAVCRPGCYCPEGLVIDRSGDRCVTPAQCDRCPPGMTFNGCGSGCGPARCGDPPNSRRFCPAVCRPGCYCPAGNFGIRLVNGSSAREGRLEIFYDGAWGTVCDDFWDLEDAHVVCGMLGYPGAERAVSRAYFGEGQGQIVLDNVQCEGSEQNLTECSHNGYGVHNCRHSEDAGVVCQGNVNFDIRLRGGSSAREGRVEIFYDGAWGTVCDDFWDLNDAHVVCRMLGYPGAERAVGRASFGEGQGQIVLDDVQCEGSEQNLTECRHNGYGVHNCRHSEDAGVECADRCPTGMVFNSCGSGCGPARCDDPPNSRRHCLAGCWPGCFCPEGLVIDRSGDRCVTPAQCDRCPSGMTFNGCGSGCGPTRCGDRFNSRRACPAVCRPGCYCPAGLVTDWSGNRCVTPAQCDLCPNGMEFLECGSGCGPASCDDPPDSARICPAVCVRGCFCLGGLVKDRSGDRCVPREQCGNGPLPIPEPFD
ncbi:uncharacterized protein [Diadema antillarum]|uniref:uncharacterized protein n=1 Tax=Diadema antillarum TaxID=105358 RepID=UPI003A88D092